MQPKLPKLAEALEAAKVAFATASSASAKAVESRAAATAQLKASNNAAVIARQAVANADAQEELANVEVKKCVSQHLQLQARLSELRATSGIDEREVSVVDGEMADAADALSAAKVRATEAAKAAESAAEQESQLASQQEAASDMLQLAEVEADRRGATAEQCRATLENAETAYNSAHKRCAVAEEAKQATDDALSQAMSRHKDCIRKRDEARARAAATGAKISAVEERRERQLDSNRHGLKRTLHEMRAALQRKAYAARDTLIAELEAAAFADDFEDDDDNESDGESQCTSEPLVRAPGTNNKRESLGPSLDGDEDDGDIEQQVPCRVEDADASNVRTSFLHLSQDAEQGVSSNGTSTALASRSASSSTVDFWGSMDTLVQEEEAALKVQSVARGRLQRKHHSGNTNGAAEQVEVDGHSS